MGLAGFALDEFMVLHMASRALPWHECVYGALVRQQWFCAVRDRHLTGVEIGLDAVMGSARSGLPGAIAAVMALAAPVETIRVGRIRDAVGRDWVYDFRIS
jgi:hypothetical protein